MLGHRNKFLKWKEAFVCKHLKVNLGKTKVMAVQRMACLKLKLKHLGSAA